MDPERLLCSGGLNSTFWSALGHPESLQCAPVSALAPSVFLTQFLPQAPQTSSLALSLRSTLLASWETCLKVLTWKKTSAYLTPNLYYYIILTPGKEGVFLAHM